MTREESLCNPGGIEIEPGVTWQGQALDQPDPTFVKFIDMAHGVRAMAVVLTNYKVRDGVLTYAGAITRWAPPASNNTQAYIEAVCQACNVQSGDDYVVDFCLLRAICDHENGRPNTITDDDITQGLALV